MATGLSIAANRGDKLSDTALIDLFGEAKEHAALLDKHFDDLKAQIKARGLDTGTLGDAFELKVSTSRYDQLDTKAVKAAMPASWVVRHSKPVSRTTITAKQHVPNGRRDDGNTCCRSSSGCRGGKGRHSRGLGDG